MQQAARRLRVRRPHRRLVQHQRRLLQLRLHLLRLSQAKSFAARFSVALKRGAQRERVERLFFFSALAPEAYSDLTQSIACCRSVNAPSNCRVSTASKISPNFGPGFIPIAIKSSPRTRGGGIIGSFANSSRLRSRNS